MGRGVIGRWTVRDAFFFPRFSVSTPLDGAAAAEEPDALVLQPSEENETDRAKLKDARARWVVCSSISTSFLSAFCVPLLLFSFSRAFLSVLRSGCAPHSLFWVVPHASFAGCAAVSCCVVTERRDVLDVPHGPCFPDSIFPSFRHCVGLRPASHARPSLSHVAVSFPRCVSLHRYVFAPFLAVCHHLHGRTPHARLSWSHHVLKSPLAL